MGHEYACGPDLKRNGFDLNVSFIEIYELRYFLAAAHHQNVHRAGEELKVSPGSVSKAIRRLEAELGVSLFRREGRGIQLSDRGRLLQRKGTAIVQQEEALKLELHGGHATMQVVFAGPEAVLARFAPEVSQKLVARHPRVAFEYRVATEARAI